MSTPNTFQEFVETYDPTPEDFPYADRGPDTYGRVVRSIWRIPIALVAHIVVGSIYKLQYNSWPEWAGNPESADSAQRAIGNVWLLVRKVLFWADTLTLWLVYLMVILAVIAIVVYAVQVTKRSRRFERDIIRNDRDARRMKTRLVSLLRVDDQLEKIHQANQKNSSGSGNSEDALGDAIERMVDRITPSHTNPEHDAQRDMLLALKNMRVNINTRQDVDGDAILRMWRINIDEPDSNEASRKLKGVVDSALARAASRVATELNRKGVSNRSGTTVINFGEPIQSADYQHWTFSTAIPVEDKYAQPEETPTEKVEKPSYEPSFDLSNLVDRSQEIEEKSAKAKKWAEGAVQTVDRILTTDEKQVNRKAIEVSASGVLFIYSLPASAKVDNFDSLIDVFNTQFATNAADVKLSAGDVMITLPVPKHLQIPIDVGAMYREVFF